MWLRPLLYAIKLKGSLNTLLANREPEQSNGIANQAIPRG